MKEEKMATFKKFEDIKAWQKARKATSAVYEATGSIRFSRDFGLRDQIQRAIVSIMANIAEGFGRHADKEFANFLNVAQASASEVQSQLYVALDLGYLAEGTLKVCTCSLTRYRGSSLRSRRIPTQLNPDSRLATSLI